MNHLEKIQKIMEFYLILTKKTQIFSINPMAFEKDIIELILKIEIS